MGTGFRQDLTVDVQVLVKQLQEEGKVLGIALVRGCRQEQKVIGVITEELPKLVLGAFVAPQI